MFYLFDTSVWIAHFRDKNDRLSLALEQDLVITHRAIIGELAVGNIPNRARTLKDLQQLRFAPELKLTEILFFIDQHKLEAQGLSLIDVELLASCKLAKAELVTLDRKLSRFWEKLK